MNTTNIIKPHSLQRWAMFFLALGFGFLEAKSLAAQDEFRVGRNWVPFEFAENLQTNLKEAEPAQVVGQSNVELGSEQARCYVSRNCVDDARLKELSARIHAQRVRRVESYLGKQTAWQDYPSAQVVQLPTNHEVVSTEHRSVTPMIIRSPFAEFSTIIPTIAAATPSQKNAESCFRNGDYAEASSAVETALKLDPNNGNLLMFAALTNLAAADYDTAGNLFVAAAAALDVANWNDVFAMADQFYGTGDNAQHMADFFEFCETSDNVNAHRLRGYLAFEIHQFDMAQKDFEFVIDNHADDEIVKKLLASGGPDSELQPSTGDNAAANAQQAPTHTTGHPLTN